MHRFLNTNKDTPLGRGLSLPISDSFFLFSSPGNSNEFTFFEGLSQRLSRRAGWLREWVRGGLIDTLHTYGAFSSATHFSRELAIRGIDALQRNAMHLRVWVNHGPPENVQCFGDGKVASFLGDAPGSDWYHTDITVDYGIEYCWAGTELGDLIAHDSGWNVSALGTYGSATLSNLRRRRRAVLRRRLLSLTTLRDERKVLSFERYWGTSGQTPVVSDIVHQLSTQNLRRLREMGGYTVVYQHFAVRRRGPGFGVEKYVTNPNPYFSPAERAAFVRLAEEYHAGNILVTSTERLLRYNRMHRWLRWKAEEVGNRLRITLLSLKMPGFRGRPVDREDIQGLTFYSSRPEETDLCIETDSGSVPVKGLSRNGRDHTGRESVGVPFLPIEARDL